MTHYLSAAETARSIRIVLKNKFPGKKFYVQSSSFSMGSSVDIKWIDGPASTEVDKALSFFSGAGFDGMIDLRYDITAYAVKNGKNWIPVGTRSTGSAGSMGVHDGWDDSLPEGATEVSFADYIHTNREYSGHALIKAWNELGYGEMPDGLITDWSLYISRKTSLPCAHWHWDKIDRSIGFWYGKLLRETSW